MSHFCIKIKTRILLNSHQGKVRRKRERKRAKEKGAVIVVQSLQLVAKRTMTVAQQSLPCHLQWRETSGQPFPRRETSCLPSCLRQQRRETSGRPATKKTLQVRFGKATYLEQPATGDMEKKTPSTKFFGKRIRIQDPKQKQQKKHVGEAINRAVRLTKELRDYLISPEVSTGANDDDDAEGDIYDMAWLIDSGSGQYLIQESDLRKRKNPTISPLKPPL